MHGTKRHRAERAVSELTRAATSRSRADGSPRLDSCVSLALSAWRLVRGAAEVADPFSAPAGTHVPRAEFAQHRR